MKKLRVVICDDKPVELERFKKMCRSICSTQGIHMELKGYSSGDIILTYLEDPKYFTKVDIILLDINMPGTNGIEVARQIRESGYNGVIIFITVSADKEHFKKAFSVRANNYFIKGDDSAEIFEDMFLNAIRDVQDNRSKVIMLYCGGGEYKQFEVNHIICFECMNRIIIVWYKNKQYECISKLGDLEEQLDGMNFQRVHRGYLVNLSHVTSMTYTELSMSNKKTIPIGRKYQQDLKDTMDKFIAE